MADHIPDILKIVNDDPSKIQKYKDDSSIRSIFQYSFDKRLKFLIPDEVEYKKNTGIIGLTDLNFYQVVRKFNIFTRKDVSDKKRLEIFIQSLEGISEEEALIMIAIKDQTLHMMYPNITGKIVSKYGFVETGFRIRR